MPFDGDGIYRLPATKRTFAQRRRAEHERMPDLLGETMSKIERCTDCDQPIDQNLFATAEGDLLCRECAAERARRKRLSASKQTEHERFLRIDAMSDLKLREAAIIADWNEADLRTGFLIATGRLVVPWRRVDEAKEKTASV